MRYFFHAEGRDRVEDEAGLALPSDLEAREEAAAMAALLTTHGKFPGSWRIIVVNELGERITDIPISKN
jgi:hypothetical protein